MTSDAESYDRKAKLTRKTILIIVVPVVFMMAGLYATSSFDVEKKPSYAKILSEIPELKCYNVNWFGQHGFQVTYTDSMQEIGELLGSYDIDFRANDFFMEPEVVDHLVLACPHIDSRLQLPDNYDPSIGLPALDKCLQVKEGFVDSEDFCLQYKR